MIPAWDLGTKNRIAQTAAACRQHLRQAHPNQRALVEEFIVEIEGPGSDAARWSQFTDLKRSEEEMLERVEQSFQKWLNPA